MRDQLGGLLGNPGYGDSFQQQYRDRNPRPPAWDKDAELAKAKAANDAQTGILGWTTDYLRGLGLPEGTLSNLNSAATFAPVTSDILDIETAGDDIGKAYDNPTWRNVGGAGLAAAMAAAGLIPGVGEGLGAVAGALKRVPFGGATPPRLAVADLRRQANIERFGYDPNEIPPAPTRAGIKAYHGSPHDFDKFDLSNIGTGEGAQAYGHGMYFAGAPDVSRSYRDTLVRSQGKDETYRIGKEDLQDVYSRLSQKADSMPASKAEAQYNKMALLEDLANDGDVLAIRARAADGAYDDATVAWFEKSIAPKFNRSGALYEVNINADPEDMLDWDKPLEGQRAFDRLKVYWDDKVGDPDIILERMGIDPKTATGGDLMQIGFDVDAGSALMKDVGVPGVKYLDAGSRGAGEGTSNYVVFDDALIEILKKYGLSGLLAGGGATYLATQGGGNPNPGSRAPVPDL